jgi:hypothetical protein
MFINLEGLGFGLFLVLIMYLIIIVMSIVSAFLIDKYLIKKYISKSKWMLILRIIIGIITTCIVFSILQIAFSLVLIPRF